MRGVVADHGKTLSIDNCLILNGKMRDHASNRRKANSYPVKLILIERINIGDDRHVLAHRRSNDAILIARSESRHPVAAALNAFVLISRASSLRRDLAAGDDGAEFGGALVEEDDEASATQLAQLDVDRAGTAAGVVEDR